MPTEARTPSFVWAILLGLGAVCWVMAAAFAMIGIRAHGVAEAARGWPTTSGKVLRSEVRTVDYRDPKTGGTARRDDIELAYTYTVDGTSYEGHNYDVTGAWHSSELRRIADENPVGAEVQVHYDPETPANSGLSIGSDGGGPFDLVAGLMGGVGLVFAGFGVRTWLRNRVTA